MKTFNKDMHLKTELSFSPDRFRFPLCCDANSAILYFWVLVSGNWRGFSFPHHCWKAVNAVIIYYHATLLLRRIGGRYYTINCKTSNISILELYKSIIKLMICICTCDGQMFEIFNRWLVSLALHDFFINLFWLTAFV